MSESLFGWNRWRLGRQLPRRVPLRAATPDERRDTERTRAAAAANIEWADEGGGTSSERAWIRDTSLHGLGLRSTCQLPVGRTVRITRPSDPALKATVRHCHPENDAFLIGVRLVGPERRRIGREPAAGPAVLSWASESGHVVRVSAQVSNVADGGLQAISESPAPIGTSIRLTGEEIGCVGSVRYCVLRGDRYLIGLQFIGEPYSRTVEQSG